MNKHRWVLGVAGAVIALVLQAAPASAQATRTWVSGVGDDANPCSRTAPCKTFAGAISKTATGGEISVLDPGGFGAVTITKSISIVARGVEGSILGALVNGVIINAPATSIVHLEGLNLEGATSGLNGVRILAGGLITIQDCTIRGFQAAAPNGFGIIYLASTAVSRLEVTNTVIEANRAGISIAAPGANINAAAFNRVAINTNTGGIGISVTGATSSLRLTDSLVQGSITTASGGQVVSFGNNALLSGSPTSTVPLQ